MPTAPPATVAGSARPSSGRLVGAGALALAAAAGLAAVAAGLSGEPVAAAVGLVGLALLWWCFSERRTDRTLAVLGLYLGLLDGYLKLRTGSSVATLGRDVLIVAITAGVLGRALARGERLSLAPLGGFVVSFAAVVLIETLNPQVGSPARAIGGVRQHLEFVPLFFLGYLVVRDRSRIRGLLYVLVLCGALNGIVSYVQSTLTPAELADWGAGYRERVLGERAFAGAARVAYGANGERAVRPFGLGSDMGAGAVAAAIALPAALTLLLRGTWALRLALLPVLGALALAVATSGTRAGVITACAAVVAFAALAAATRNGRRIALGLGLACVLVFAAFAQIDGGGANAERTRSVLSLDFVSRFFDERGDSVRMFPEYAVDHPLGIGVGSVGPAASAFGERSETARTFDAETEWNYLVLETGVIGVLLYLGLNARVLGLAITRIRRYVDPTLRLELAAIAAPLLALLVAGFAGPTSSSVPATPYFWLACGVLAYWLVTAPRRGPPTAADPPIGTAAGPRRPPG